MRNKRITVIMLCMAALLGGCGNRGNGFERWGFGGRAV